MVPTVGNPGSVSALPFITMAEREPSPDYRQREASLVAPVHLPAMQAYLEVPIDLLFAYRRDGHDLIYQKKISLTEALRGFKTIIKHLDGRTLVTAHPPGGVLKPNSIRAIMGQGGL